MKLLVPLIHSKGFTVVEFITSIAIIGILSAVSIQQYSQYKIRGYDAHSKQALHYMNLTCKAFWTDNGTSEECGLTKSKEYGFVQHPDVVAAIPSSEIDTFCASAKHNDSPNTFSIDSAALVSPGTTCSGDGEGTNISSEQKAPDKCEIKGLVRCRETLCGITRYTNACCYGSDTVMSAPLESQMCLEMPQDYRSWVCAPPEQCID